MNKDVFYIKINEKNNHTDYYGKWNEQYNFKQYLINNTNFLSSKLRLQSQLSPK